MIKKLFIKLVLVLYLNTVSFQLFFSKILFLMRFVIKSSKLDVMPGIYISYMSIDLKVSHLEKPKQPMEDK